MPDHPIPGLSRREAVLALAVGAGLAAALAWSGRSPGAGLGWRVAFVSLHVVGCAGLWALLRRRAPTVGQLLLGAALFRLLALPMEPVLSDDGFRYLWDGRMTVEAGVSPYALRPSDPELAAWQADPLFERMNSPDYFSVYPPASQAVFAAAVTLYPPLGWRGSWTFLKCLLLLAEGIGIVCLLRVVGPRLTALYAWSPLAVIEVAGQGHTEALVVAGLGLVLVGGRLPLASLGATLGGLAKLYPFALLPFAWRRDGWAGVWVTLVLALALGALVWAPDALKHAGESVGLFFGTFDQYAAPYRLLKSALFPVLGAEVGRTASVLLAGLFLGALLLAWLADDGTRRSLVIALGVGVVGFALTASTLHPWYWLPVIWLSPLLHHRSSLSWLATASSLTYLGYVLPGATTAVTAVGWGGALLLAVWPRGHGR